jgi:hypothetical protein
MTMNYRRFARFILFAFFAIALSDISCTARIDKFSPLNYFPLQLGNTWEFNGEIRTMKVTDASKIGHERYITFTFYDSLDVALWAEKYHLIKDQLRWVSFEPGTSLLPHVTYNPPLIAAPFSDKPGDTDSISSIETQTDSVVITNAITVDYQIQSVEDVQTPAGMFANCIKMKINFIYPTAAQRPLFIGEHYWWFSSQVGPVKYDLPTAYGELVKLDLNRFPVSKGRK